MLRALYSATTGMLAQQANLDIVSNNLSNVNTIGFKKTKAGFQDLLYSTIREPNTQTTKGTLPNALRVGNGVRIAATENVFTQGTFINSDNPLDVALSGDGFFRVQLQDGKFGYTRDGALKIDSQGRLVTSEGYYMVKPEVKVPSGAKDIAISKDGGISAVVPGQEGAQFIGQIELAKFVNPDGLEPIGMNIFVETVNSGTPQMSKPGTAGTGSIIQGALESSNVEVAEEFVNMMMAQKAYEFGSKAIQTSDQMLSIANNLRGGS
jgi:flagellar basal-body rod protein FlgG